MNEQSVYIAGPLTHAVEPKKVRLFYENIGALCAKVGLDPYIPHLVTDPCKHKEFTPEQIFKIDRDRVKGSALVVAYIGEPSLGVGMELAFAAEAEVPVILLYKEDATVSRFARGNPYIVKEIKFTSQREALAILYNTLISLSALM